MLHGNKELSENEKIDWLRLWRSENVGPVTFFRLLERFQTPAKALAALPELAKRGGGRKITVAGKAEVVAEIEAAKKIGAELIAWPEAAYPRLLKQIEDPPPLFYALGQNSLLQSKHPLGIVGSRNASAAGMRRVKSIARDLGQAGLTIVSGLARGVDTAAHEGALETGTIAVVAGGVDIVYPPDNLDLYRRIAECGVIVSETPPGVEPLGRHFPRRNRIISGLSLGVVVAEASLRSGSLITAKFASDQGREVFAIPGSPEDPRSSGPNSLLKQGASLVENADDILRGLENILGNPLGEMDNADFTPPPSNPLDEKTLDEVRTKVVSLLGATPVEIDEIIRHCQWSTNAVQAAILELELAGRLDRHPGQKVSLMFEAA